MRAWLVLSCLACVSPVHGFMSQPLTKLIHRFAKRDDARPRIISSSPPVVLTKADVSATVAEQLITVVLPVSSRNGGAVVPANAPDVAIALPIEEEVEPQPLNHWPLVPIYACVFTQWLGYGLGLSTMPMHMVSLGFKATDLGGVQACFSLAMMLSCPLLVRRSSRAGRLAVLRLCLAVGTLSSFLLAFAGCASAASPQRLAAMMGARALAGFAGACIPVAQAAVSDVVRDPAQRANALAVVQASSSLGIVVGPPLAALLHLLFGSVLGLSTGAIFLAVFAIDGIVSALSLLALRGRTVVVDAHAVADTAVVERDEREEVEGMQQQWEREQLKHQLEQQLLLDPGPKQRRHARTDGGGGRPLGGGGGGRDEATIEKPAVAAAVTRPAADVVKPSTGELWRQNLFRAVAFVCRWKMITGLSTYQLYTQRFLGYGALSRSAALSLSAATQFGVQLLVLPRLMPKLGEHRTTSLGLLLIGVGFAGCGLISAQPLHAMLYWAACAGLALAETGAAVLASRYSRCEVRRDANLGMLQSLQACSNIFAPLVAGLMFEGSLTAAFRPGALPILFTGALGLAAVPLPLIVKYFDTQWDAMKPVAASEKRE